MEQVWVYTLATGENVYVTSGEYLAWSPQGDILAVAEGNLYLVSLSNLTRTQVTHDMVVADPTWAPDGQRLAFDVLLQQPADPQGIFVIAADGAGLTRITTAPGAPAWSPDGTKIAFVQGNDLFTMSVDGQNRVHLAYDPNAPGDPAWSPDGRFLAWNEHGYATMTLHADGSDNHIIRVGVFEPAWSPDGSQIACAMIKPGTPGHIYLGLMNADGSNPRFLTGPSASKP